MSLEKQPPLVLHLIYALGTGGLENGLVNIINRMPAERYRHVIVCLTEAHDFKNRISASGVEVIELHKRPGHDFRLYGRLWRVIRALKPDIIHSRNLNALEMQAIAFLSSPAKRVHGEHGRDVSDLHGQSRKYNRLRKVMRTILHRYIAVSQDLAQWLEDIVNVVPEKVVQIYNGVDQTRFYPNQAEGAYALPKHLVAEGMVVIGTVGRLAAVKDQLSLVLAFTKLIERNPDYRSTLRLVIVGDGSYRQEIESRICRAGLEAISWLPGDRSDIPELLRSMDIFVLPSLGEGVSNTVLEAMATGLPIIATDVGGNPELVEHNLNGFIVPVGDPLCLADNIEVLVQDAHKRQCFGAASSDKITKKFNWEKTVTSYMQVYDQLLMH